MSMDWINEQIILTQEAIKYHKEKGLYCGHLEKELEDFLKIKNK